VTSTLACFVKFLKAIVLSKSFCYTRVLLVFDDLNVIQKNSDDEYKNLNFLQTKTTLHILRFLLAFTGCLTDNTTPSYILSFQYHWKDSFGISNEIIFSYIYYASVCTPQLCG